MRPAQFGIQMYTDMMYKLYTMLRYGAWIPEIYFHTQPVAYMFIYILHAGAATKPISSCAYRLRLSTHFCLPCSFRENERNKSTKKRKHKTERTKHKGKKQKPQTSLEAFTMGSYKQKAEGQIMIAPQRLAALGPSAQGAMSNGGNLARFP